MSLQYMVSYAQNFEDVMLRRALQGVTQGFYIDVGAQDPVEDSVTKHFYDRGWRGINIEPNPTYFARVREARPRDTNVLKAVSKEAGLAQFVVVDNSGLSSLDLKVKALAAEHGLRTREIEVEVTTLNDLLALYPPAEIHFLKIDVEGAEADVLQGFDLARFRPWIILVEATLPTLPIPNWETFEHLITSRGYHAVYFDGLNKWYVRDESSALDAHFKVPPNPFDYFERWREAEYRKLKARTATVVPTQNFGTLFSAR